MFTIIFDLSFILQSVYQFCLFSCKATAGLVYNFHTEIDLVNTAQLCQHTAYLLCAIIAPWLPPFVL